MIGIYEHKDSLIHKMNPKIKILSMILNSLLLFFFQSWFFFILDSIFIILIYSTAKFSFSLILKKLKAILIFLIIIFLTNIITKNWFDATKSVIKVMNLILFSSLISLTTKTSELIVTLDNFLKFFSCTGINHKKFL